MKCTVVGAGAWGTALGNLLSENGHETTVWAYEADVAESINTAAENRRFLAGVPLHSVVRREDPLALVGRYARALI